jgi:ribosome maturation factor RimP
VAAVSNERLQSLLTPVVEAIGVDFEDVKVRKAGSRSVVVITVDQDGGIDLDTVASVSRKCSEALDENDLFGETPYVLEVTSPGVDRPLTQARHWRRAKDRLVNIELADGRRVRGRIGDATDTAAQILTDTGVESISYSDVARAVVEVEFNSPKGSE